MPLERGTLCGVEAEAPAAVDALVVVKNLGVDSFAQGRADGTPSSSACHSAQQGAGNRAEGESCRSSATSQQRTKLCSQVRSPCHSRCGCGCASNGAYGTPDPSCQVAGNDAVGVAVGTVQVTPGW